MSYYTNVKCYENECACDEDVGILQLVEENFSEDSVAEVLCSAGLTQEKKPRFSESMEKLVFMHGESDETYSPSEIRFIEQIGNVLVYPDFTKAFNGGDMPCRAIVTRLDCDETETIRSCVCFEKIINKALDGFNVFLFVTEIGVFFGCRIFGKTQKCNCTLTSPITHEEELDLMVEELETLSTMDSFIKYYISLCQAITDGQVKEYDYDDLMVRRRGVQVSYLESLDAVERDLGIDMAEEKERYQSFFDAEPKEPFENLFKDAYESLSFIKSNRINTYELLFEADEAMRQSEAAEFENMRFAQMSIEDLDECGDQDDEEAKMLLDDPEEMVKLLKKRRGI